MEALNRYRECYFKYDGDMVICERETAEFNRCQENPKWYAEKVYPRMRGLEGDYNAKVNRSRY